MTLFNLFNRREHRDYGPLTFARLLGLGTNTAAGVPMNEALAETISAVWRSANLIANVSAAVPLVAYKAGSKEAASPYPRILNSPHPYLTPYQLWRLAYWHQIFTGIAIQVKHTNAAGQLGWLEPIHPSRADVYYDKRTGNRALVLDGDKENPLISTEFVLYMINSEDGITGRSVIQVARESLGIAKAADTMAAKQFGNGTMVSGILSTDEELDEDEIVATKARWRAKFSGIDNAHDIVVTHSGLKFQQIGMSNEEAQFLQTRHFQVAEISRWFGVPLFLLNETEKSTSWGTGLEQQAIGWVRFDLAPTWLTPMEQQITKDVLLNPVTQAKYNVAGLLRGDTAALVSWLQAMWGMSALSPNEIRDANDMPPSNEPGMNKHYIRISGSPTAVPISDAQKGAPPQPQAAPAPAEDEPADDATDTAA